MRDLLLIAVVVLCSLIALRRPVFGMLAFVCLSLLNPHSMTWGIGRTFPFAQLTAIGTIVGYCFWSEPKRFPRQREFWLLLALWGMFGVSTLFAIEPEDALERFMHISKILLMIFLSMSLINNEHRLHLLLRVIALTLGFYGLKSGIFSVISGGSYMVWGPEGSFLAANNAIGMAMVMNIPLLFYGAKMESYWWLRWLMRVMIVFSYPAVICTFSRGAWLGLALVTWLLICKSKHRLRVMTLTGCVGFMLLPFLLSRLPDRVASRYDDLVNYEAESSAQSRFWNWELCKRVGMAHPLHGGGFDYYSLDIYPKYYPEFIDRWGEGKVWSCHSSWFTIFGEHGFPGILLWIGMLGSALYSLNKIYFYAKQHQELEWAINYIKMTQIALYAYILINTFYDAAYFDLYYQLIALSIIIKQIVFKFYINERISKSIPKTVSEKVNLGSGMHLIRDVTSQ
jgi:probable O-glycosylation ligase (exosortase A-associated)